MTLSDKEKLERLKHRFDLNYKITRLYAEYLSYYPEIINKDMIDELTRDADIDDVSAITFLLAEIFGLDDEKGGDDRRLIRDYLAKSVRVLDTQKYTSNPYYKNIKIEDIKDGEWEFLWEEYAPFRAVVAADIIFGDDGKEIPPLCFFKESFHFPAVLESGNEWMTLTPVDIDTCDEAIEAAHGKVITFGLGLGYYAYMVSEKPEVTSVTVVERSEKVIELFNRHILPQFPNKDKVKIVCSDAFLYAENLMPKEKYDLAFVDTWRDASDGAPMYKKMKALEHLSPDTEFMYWIENFLISRLRAERFEELLASVENGEENAPKTYCEFEKRLADILHK